MKIMIAGLGSIGRRHLRNLLRLGEQDILLFRTGKSTLADDELAEFPVESDLPTALAQEPAAVIVANPTSLHLDVAIPAAEAGCHLFIEKPVSHSWKRINDLKDAVRRGGGQVVVGFQFRLHPSLQEMRRILREGEIGRPISARWHWGEYLPDWHPWEDYHISYAARSDLGGGVVLTQCHGFDYFRWLLGEVAEVWAVTGNLGDLELEVEDTAEVGLRFAHGSVGSVHLDYYQRPPLHRIEIIGTEATIIWDSWDAAIQMRSATHGIIESKPISPTFERNDMFLEEMRQFISVIKGQSEPVCSLSDGIAALEIALAARESADTGKIVAMNGNRD
jgi:predicted dehydrogenase